VIERAVAAGIERILVPGYDLASSRAALELASTNPDLLRAAVGVHPHHAAQMDEAGWAELEQLAAETDVVAVGEIGLDYFRNLSPADVQRATFSRQLELAGNVGKPVLVHDRDAHDDVTEALLVWEGPGSAVRGVLHAFSGDAAMAASLTEAGYLISFALPLRFRSAEGPRAAARDLPEGAFLVETDSPWLAPGGAKARNEPTTALRVAAELSRLRAEAVEDVVRQVRDAFERLVAASAPAGDAPATTASAATAPVATAPAATAPAEAPEAGTEVLAGPAVALEPEPAASTTTAAAGDPTERAGRLAMGVAVGALAALAVIALLFWLLVLQGGAAAAVDLRLAVTGSP
jgi:TatD DNase family protein